MALEKPSVVVVSKRHLMVAVLATYADVVAVQGNVFGRCSAASRFQDPGSLLEAL